MFIGARKYHRAIGPGAGEAPPSIGNKSLQLEALMEGVRDPGPALTDVVVHIRARCRCLRTHTTGLWLNDS